MHEVCCAPFLAADYLGHAKHPAQCGAFCCALSPLNWGTRVLMDAGRPTVCVHAPHRVTREQEFKAG